MNTKVNFILILLLLVGSLSAQDLKFGKVSKEEVEEKFYPQDSTAVAAYLYKYRRTHYEFNNNIGFNIVNDYHIRIKVYDKKGVDFGNFDIKYFDPEDGKGDKITGLNGYVFNLDEKGNLDKQKLSKDNIFKERLNKFRVTNKIAMPNVKEGSVIELEYSISSPFLYYVDDLEFQSAIPYKKYSAKIEIPEYLIFNKHSKGYYAIAPKAIKKSGQIPYFEVSNNKQNERHSDSYQYKSIDYTINVDEYDAENIPALKDDEPYISNINNYYGGISYELSMTRFPNQEFQSFTNTWEKVCKTIYDSKGFGDQLEPANFYKDDVDAATASATNQIQKIAAIFSLVKSKVKWNEYYGKYSTNGIRSAYKEGTGDAADINLLLTSMLNSVGVNANPVLVSTRNNGIPFFPTLDGFNYVITMVEFEDNSYMLLDATEPYSLPNILPVRALNWNGRKVTKGGFSSWVKLTSKKPSESDYNLMVKVTDDGLVEGLLRKRSENLNAMQERNMYNHVKEDALIKMFEERYNIEIEDSNFRFTNQLDLGKPLNYMAKFTSEDLVESISDKLYMYPLLFLATTQNPFKNEERKFPVDFNSPWKNNYTVSIQIPDGYKVESSPESMAIALPDEKGVFKYQVTVSNQKIIVNAYTEFKESIINPDLYPVLKKFYTDLVAKQSEKIVLSKI